MTTKISIAFVGPLPPPLGGVAVMNESFQDIMKDTFDIVSYNTSSGAEREDLYSNRFVKKAAPQLIRLKAFMDFVRQNSFTTANLFVTTGLGFIREAFFIIVLKMLGKKLIIHFHSKKKGEFFLGPLRIRILAFFVNKADHIVMLSDDHCKYFEKYFDKRKISVIENFVDYANYDCNINEKVGEFLYVGRLSEKKGFFDLLESITLLKKEGVQVLVNVVGAPENDEVDERIKEYVKAHQIDTFLRFYGLKFDEEKYKLFKQCRFFLFPSQFENSPVVLKEAIAAKMAILSSDIDANRNVMKVVDHAMFYPAGDEKSLAESIKSLLANDALAEEMMKSAEKVKIYDKSIAREKLLNVIHTLEAGAKKKI
ncbi:glycosyltransferase family 4 protein [Sulfurovum mangrovi]|uniref:glycosyltransferase family 4 protein n=1 Tax=Sulfurovum mangrovi TaxID=2893889 RepID=UPI001E305D19|nr:glycosyltransferase family 4 protein [Sulfurovum mangrovi]UFH59213.1 glycosyltransferase family 4 protein [Sulfurovum mangrovi]